MARFIYARPDELYDKQLAAFFEPKDVAGGPARYSWIEGSTKSGKTYSCMCWLLEQAIVHGKPGREFWWVAPVASQAEIAFNRIRRQLPPNAAESKQTPYPMITLLNGAVLRFKSGEKTDNLYGEDVWAAVMDEASRMRQEAFYAVRSTLTATGGPLRIIGNVKGRKNWFFIGSRKAEAGEPNHSYHKITAADAVAAGVFPQSELDDAARALPLQVFRELYFCEPSDDGGNPFGLQFIRQNVRERSRKPPVVFGVDLAKSYDWTVIHGLDSDGNTCVFERFQLPWAETMKRIQLICGAVPAFIDSTGVGDPIVEQLQRIPGLNITGYKFSAQSKQMLMEGLALAIQQSQVYYPEGVIPSELEAFEYEYTRTGVRYAAPEGQHDDCVMALALAVYGIANRKPEPQVFLL